jgi:hypothetical protein
MKIKLKNNEALSTSFTIHDVNFSANTFSMKIADKDNVIKKTCTLNASYVAPDTIVTVLLSQSDVNGLGLGKFRSDVKMTSTVPIVIIPNIEIEITSGVS